MYGKESKIKKNMITALYLNAKKRFEISLALFVCEIRLWFKINKNIPTLWHGMSVFLVSIAAYWPFSLAFFR